MQRRPTTGTRTDGEMTHASHPTRGDQKRDCGIDQSKQADMRKHAKTIRSPACQRMADHARDNGIETDRKGTTWRPDDQATSGRQSKRTMII
jgi:hypothetical protein